MKKIKLGSDEYFVLGDDRQNEDSRNANVGKCEIQLHLRKAWFVISPKTHFGFCKGEICIFQWYPGHMTKAKRMMVENIKLIDLIIELVDARVPLSSRNWILMSLVRIKRLIILNKSDLQRKDGMRHGPNILRKRIPYCESKFKKRRHGVKIRTKA